MPDNGTSQGIDVGDAVLTFLADSTQLDTAFQKIPAQADAAMSAASKSVDKLGASVNKVSEGFTGFDNIVDESFEAWDGLTPRVKQASEAVDGLEYSFREARGSIALTAEQLGVHLPRELTMLLAHIPLVGAAFEVMLPIAGVVAAIAVIGELIAKHEEMEAAIRHEAETSESLSIKQQDMTRSLQAANLQLEDQIRKLEGRPEVNKLQIALINVQKAVDELASTYSNDFAKMDKNIETEVGLWQKIKDGAVNAGLAIAEVANVSNISAAQRIAMQSVERDSLRQVLEAEDKLNEARRKLSDTNPAKDMEAWKAAAGAVAIAAGQVQKAADTAHAAVAATKPDAHELLASLTDRAIEARGEWQAIAEKIKGAGLEIRKVNQEMANDAAERASTQAKRAMDQQIASIDAWKSAQHAAYDTGKIDAAAWQVAEMRATDAVAIAKEDYLRKLVSIYTRAGETEKAHAAQEQLAALQTKNEAEAVEKLAASIQKHSQAVRKVREEYDQLIASNVDKEFEKTQKAAEGLTRAEEELSKVQTKAAETDLAARYRDQESAIQKLVQMKLITEQQMNDRLALLEQQQANEAIAILEKQLAKQQADMQAAQAKLASQKSSAFVSPAQVIETEVNLKKIEGAVVATESQIAQQKEKYNKQAEADDKSHYGRALLLAMAAGNQLLAEQLRENHAALLSAQSNLADAKARGVDTTAIEQQVRALKQNETELQKEANGAKSVRAVKVQNIQQSLLSAQAELAEAKARGQNTTALQQEVNALQKLLTLMRQQPAEMKQVSAGLQGLKLGYQQLGQMVKNTEQQMSQAYASAIAGALESGKSIGAALEQATKQVLMQLATQALAKAIFYTAEGLANVVFDPPLAATYFAAAGEFALVAGVAGGVGMAMPGGSSGSGGSGGGGGAPGAGPGAGLNPQQSSFAGGGGQQVQGVTRLARGGIVSQPTMFGDIMAGDSPSGGAAEEAILPLSDPEAMRKVAQSIMGSIIPVSQDRGKEAAMVSTASAVSNLPGNDFGVPSVRERPDFNFSSTPIPRESPDVQAMAARFGGLLSAPTLRAATAASNQAARASAETAASPGGFDSGSFEKFADRVGQHITAGQGPTTEKDSGAPGGNHVHVNVKGMISPDNLNKVIKKISQRVQNRQATLHASNSLRLTRRSQ